MKPMKPMFALHKDADDRILNAGSFDYSHHLDTWLRSLDCQPGDKIEFGEKATRANEASVQEAA